MNSKVEYSIDGVNVYTQLDVDTVGVLNYAITCPQSTRHVLTLSGKVTAVITADCDIETLVRKANGIATRTKPTVKAE
jgi:hypothetical protein